MCGTNPPNAIRHVVHPMTDKDTTSSTVLIVHPTHHKEAHLHSGSDNHSLPPLCSLPPLPFRHCCLKSACLSSEDAFLNKPIHFFKRFLSFHYKKGGDSNGKAEASILSFPLDTWKAKSEWQSSEYLCVCTHSSFKANICPEHWQTQMFSSR